MADFNDILKFLSNLGAKTDQVAKTIGPSTGSFSKNRGIQPTWANILGNSRPSVNSGDGSDFSSSISQVPTQYIMEQGSDTEGEDKDDQSSITQGMTSGRKSLNGRPFAQALKESMEAAQPAVDAMRTPNPGIGDNEAEIANRGDYAPAPYNPGLGDNEKELAARGPYTRKGYGPGLGDNEDEVANRGGYTLAPYNPGLGENEQELAARGPYIRKGYGSGLGDNEDEIANRSGYTPFNPYTDLPHDQYAQYLVDNVGGYEIQADGSAFNPYTGDIYDPETGRFTNTNPFVNIPKEEDYSSREEYQRALDKYMNMPDASGYTQMQIDESMLKGQKNKAERSARQKAIDEAVSNLAETARERGMDDLADYIDGNVKLDALGNLQMLQRQNEFERDIRSGKWYDEAKAEREALETEGFGGSANGTEANTAILPQYIPTSAGTFMVNIPTAQQGSSNASNSPASQSGKAASSPTSTELSGDNLTQEEQWNNFIASEQGQHFINDLNGYESYLQFLADEDRDRLAYIMGNESGLNWLSDIYGYDANDFDSFYNWWLSDTVPIDYYLDPLNNDVDLNTYLNLARSVLGDSANAAQYLANNGSSVDEFLIKSALEKTNSLGATDDDLYDIGQLFNDTGLTTRIGLIGDDGQYSNYDEWLAANADSMLADEDVQNILRQIEWGYNNRNKDTGRMLGFK